MHQKRFDQANTILRRPDGMSKEDCQDLVVYRGKDATGRPVVISCWEPSDEDRERIAAGDDVYLHVIGDTMPPACVSIGSPWSRRSEADWNPFDEAWTVQDASDAHAIILCRSSNAPWLRVIDTEPRERYFAAAGIAGVLNGYGAPKNWLDSFARVSETELRAGKCAVRACAPGRQAAKTGRSDDIKAEAAELMRARLIDALTGAWSPVRSTRP